LAARFVTQAGAVGWPKFVPIRAKSSPTGMPTNGSVRRSPLLAPVIETSTTGRPASSCGTELFRFDASIMTRSMAFSVLLKNQAPGADPDSFHMARCAAFGVGTSYSSSLQIPTSAKIPTTRTTARVRSPVARWSQISAPDRAASRGKGRARFQ
jgi:hypothetical protein